jgi:hypothetical protein
MNHEYIEKVCAMFDDGKLSAAELAELLLKEAK